MFRIAWLAPVIAVMSFLSQAQLAAADEKDDAARQKIDGATDGAVRNPHPPGVLSVNLSNPGARSELVSQLRAAANPRPQYMMTSQPAAPSKTLPFPSAPSKTAPAPVPPATYGYRPIGFEAVLRDYLRYLAESIETTTDQDQLYEKAVQALGIVSILQGKG